MKIFCKASIFVSKSESEDSERFEEIFTKGKKYDETYSIGRQYISFGALDNSGKYCFFFRKSLRSKGFESDLEFYREHFVEESLGDAEQTQIVCKKDVATDFTEGKKYKKAYLIENEHISVGALNNSGMFYCFFKKSLYQKDVGYFCGHFAGRN